MNCTNCESLTIKKCHKTWAHNLSWYNKQESAQYTQNRGTLVTGIDREWHQIAVTRRLKESDRVKIMNRERYLLVGSDIWLGMIEDVWDWTSR